VMSRQTVELWTASGRADLAAVQVVAKQLMPKGIVFLSSPSAWRALHIDATGESDLDDTVFDARWFSPAGEIRWRRHEARSRVAALITDGDLASRLDRTMFPTVTKAEAFGVLHRQYRCWPVAAAVPGERTVVVHTARVAPIELPLRAPVPPGGAGTVTIIARELVADVGYGNQRVVHELLADIVTEVNTTTLEESHA